MLSVRFTEHEYAMFEEIVNRRNENSPEHCRLSKTYLLKKCLLNWVIDNKDNGTAFPERPQSIIKHDV